MHIRQRLAVLMFFQWHHPSILFISISPGTFWVKSCHFFTPFFFIPLVIASVSGAQLACFCREGRKKKRSPIQMVESLYVRVSDQHGCTLKCFRCRLDAEALSPHQQSVSLSFEDVKGCRITPAGCWQKQQLDLTKKKKKRKYSNWPC